VRQWDVKKEVIKTVKLSTDFFGHQIIPTFILPEDSTVILDETSINRSSIWSVART
jgi:hypothetical protein